LTTAEQVIEEIRASRIRMSDECENDPAKYITYLKGFNDKYSAEVKAYRDSRRQAPQEPDEVSPQGAGV